jgi:RNA polymerase sigma factor (sigma-70 family)
MAVLAAKSRQTVPENVNRAAKLFIEYGDFIRSIIRYKIKNEDLTEDIYQDLFIHFVIRPVPDDVQSTKGFLYKVISDKITDSFRRMESYKTRISSYAARIENITENSSDKRIIDLEEIEKMFTLIEKTLPQNEARAVILKFRDNFDTTMISKRMRIKSRSVSRYVSVGIKKLRDILPNRREHNNGIH